MADDLSPENIKRLLGQLHNVNERNSTAAALSKVAAKADDDVLMMLSKEAGIFVSWLTETSDDPLVKAYTACILANIAFLAPGQEKVLEANGVKPLVRMLKQKDNDKKITLHSTAAVQNLTYKNTACCQQVLEEGGESALKKLLKHKSEDVQQFAAGALANLQLYRKADDDSSGASPTGRSAGGGAGSMMSRRVAKILRRKPAAGASDSGGGAGPSAIPQGLMGLKDADVDNAASIIQACYHGKKQREKFNADRERKAKKEKKKNKYGGGGSVLADARADLEAGPGFGGLRGALNKAGGGLPGIGGGGFGGGGGSGWDAGPLGAALNKRPARLAPLPSIGGAGGGMGHLPPMPSSLPEPPPMPQGGGFGGGMPGLGGGGGFGGPRSMPPLGGMR